MTMTDDEEYDDGPFFDLVFSSPDNKYVMSSTTTDYDSDNETVNYPCLPVSPPLPDDLFCLSDSEPVFKTPLRAYSLLRSATKLRIFSLTFNKPKFLPESPGPEMLNNNKKKNSKQNSTTNKKLKLFTVKFKVVEVPMMSLFTKKRKKSPKNPESRSAVDEDSRARATNAAQEEGMKLRKEKVKRYLKKVKTVYIDVSKRYVGYESDGMSSSFGVNEEEEQGQRQGKGLQGVVGTQLGKSRSASSTARSTPPHWSGQLGLRRRDDSLLLQEDGIQSAILHCKRSFNASSRKIYI